MDNADGVVLDHSVHQGSPPDAPLLAPAIRRIRDLVGRAPKAVTADRGYGEARIEDELTPDRRPQRRHPPARPGPVPPAGPKSTAARSPAWPSDPRGRRGGSPIWGVALPGPHPHRRPRRCPGVLRARRAGPQRHQDPLPSRTRAPRRLRPGPGPSGLSPPAHPPGHHQERISPPDPRPAWPHRAPTARDGSRGGCEGAERAGIRPQRRGMGYLLAGGDAGVMPSAKGVRSGGRRRCLDKAVWDIRDLVRSGALLGRCRRPACGDRGAERHSSESASSSARRCSNAAS